MRTSLKSIASELGVSPSTVSRVVNGNKSFSVSPEMRDKILARVSDAGYTPNPLYQAMRQKDNKQIAIMLPNLLRLAGASEISAGVDRLCERMMAYGFKFYYIGRTQVSLKTYGLPMWKVAMAVVVDTNNAEMIEELDSSGIPYVSLNGETGPNGTAITTDDYANMKMAMEYLTGLGHSHICYINFYRRDKTSGAIMEDQHPSIATRLKAYEDSCAKTGFKPCEESLRRDIDVNATINAGLNANCTAFVAYNFPLAMETSAILQSRGLRVPEDVSVMAFNNPELAEFASPPMTCVELPVETMGNAAADVLMGKHRDSSFEKGRTIAFKGRLVERASTGPCLVKHP